MSLSTPELQTIGGTLYGNQWITELARQLPANRRTVQRWASGVNAPPPWLRDALVELVEAELAAARAALKVRRKYERPEIAQPLAALEIRVEDLLSIQRRL